MALRLPGVVGAGRSLQTGVDVLDHELAGEMATALGRAGRRVEEAMMRLRAEPAEKAAREALLKEAAAAVHAYFIQRELCGMRRHDAVIKEYGIPPAVLARLGAG